MNRSELLIELLELHQNIKNKSLYHKKVIDSLEMLKTLQNKALTPEMIDLTNKITNYLNEWLNKNNNSITYRKGFRVLK